MRGNANIILNEWLSCASSAFVPAMRSGRGLRNGGME